MARSKKGRKGKTTKPVKIKQNPKTKLPKCKSSSSETSPFKGFDTDRTPNVYHAEDPFDRLLEKDTYENLHKNIRTYSNKTKSSEKRVLEFSDCKNRDEILKWLANTQNVFDSLPQTQFENASDVENCTLVTFDMPSVSQQNTPRESKVRRKSVKSPYKLRPRSLNIEVSKNLASSRSRSYSDGHLNNVGVSHVEDLFEIPVPAENVIAIIDLMEDEYLSNLEREMDQKKNSVHNDSGWDRIKDISKTLPKAKKQPKQLKVVLTPSPVKKNPQLSSVDYNTLENYFVDNMKKLMEENNPVEIDDSITSESVLETGKKFVTDLNRILRVQGRDKLHIFKDIYEELKKHFGNSTHQFTQTCVNNYCDKNIQTEYKTASVSIQTVLNVKNAIVQTSLKPTVPKYIQTDDKFKVNVEIQTESSNIKGPILKKYSTNSTPDGLSPENSVRVENEEIVFVSNVVQSGERNEAKDIFDDEFDFNINTEEFLKNEIKTPSVEEIAVNVDNVAPSNKGIKRVQVDFENEEHESKRPCAKFINDDLSVDFSSCVDTCQDKDTNTDFDKNADNFKLTEGTNKLAEDYFKPATYFPLNEQTPPISSSKYRSSTSSPNLFSESLFYNDTMSTKDTKNNLTIRENPKINILENILLTGVMRKEKSDYSSGSSDVIFVEAVPKSKKLFSESLFGDVTVISNKTLVANSERENGVKTENCENQNEELEVKEEPENQGFDSDSDDTYCLDVVDSTPQKKKYFTLSQQRKESALDITLPPPLEFQDSERHSPLKSAKKSTPPRRPLADITKITSTPLSQKPNSEQFPNLSPISCHAGVTRMIHMPTKMSEKKKSAPNAFEYAELQLKKQITPLTIIKKPQENFKLSGTSRQKSILNYVTSQDDERKNSSFESTKRKACIACSRLSKDQVLAISAMTNRKLATYSTCFSSKVTHLIVSVDEKNCLQDHTIKYVSAVAAGIWVLNFEWVRKCLVRNSLVSEEPFEVLDVSGLPGPSNSRVYRSTRPLLKGYKLHPAPPFVNTSQQEIENLIRMLGGKVAPKPEHLLDKNGYNCIIVTEARDTENFELYETWLEVLKVVTVDLEWLTRSIGQYKLLSLRPFTLCSDDLIDGLGYPSELTENVPTSFSQQSSFVP